MGSVPIKEVETALAAFPGLAEVAVAEQDVKPAGHLLVAYVAPSGIDLSALHLHARQLLPGHLVPAAIVVLDEIPLTAEGTPDLATLQPPELDGLMPYRMPATNRQDLLCEIFAEVLRVPRVGIDDDFFNLGGQSVDAMLIVGRIRTSLGARMVIADLFDAPTVAELDRRLDVAASAAK